MYVNLIVAVTMVTRIIHATLVGILTPDLLSSGDASIVTVISNV